MGKKKKRRIKIKVKNCILLLLFLILFLFGISEIVVCITKVVTTPREEEKEKKKTKEETQLEELENIQNKITYFNKEYLERYLEYKKKNKNLSNTQIIKNVNMNLDLIPYEDKRKAKNLNTEKILVNKYYYLEEDYIPENLEPINTQYALEGMKLVVTAKNAFEQLSKEAKKEGLNIIAMSSYRSYDYQVNLYNRYVKEDGQEKADTYSGRPGHSEHQTGLAVDVYNKTESYTNFEKTKEYEWMMEHADEYGFILRFPKEKEKETGYQFESWHYRYVGKEIASYIKKHNISLEEYYATQIKDW